MQSAVRKHVKVVTGVLTVVALALVFAAVLGAVPESLLPRVETLVDVIPHLNAIISFGAIGTILSGIVSIKRGEIDRHRRMMIASTLLFAGFLVLYLYRVSLEGPTAFEGPDFLRQFIYLPLLGVHVLLAIVCIPFVFYALLLAGVYPVTELPETPHPRVGRIAATLWVISFALGIVVYLLLYVAF